MAATPSHLERGHHHRLSAGIWILMGSGEGVRQGKEKASQSTVAGDGLAVGIESMGGEGGVLVGWGLKMSGCRALIAKPHVFWLDAVNTLEQNVVPTMWQADRTERNSAHSVRHHRAQARNRFCADQNLHIGPLRHRVINFLWNVRSPSKTWAGVISISVNYVTLPDGISTIPSYIF
jgi:hypothetical protein